MPRKTPATEHPRSMASTHVADAPDRQFATNLARGLDVLRAFGPGDRLLGNRDIAQRTGLPRPTVSRLTYTLTLLGYLVRIERLQKYRLGSGVLMLGYPLLASLPIRQIARPHMEDLARATGGSVNLGMLGRLEVVYIDTLRLDQGNVLQPDIGSARPLLRTAIGRALLLSVDARERSAILNRLRVADAKAFAADRPLLDPDAGRFARQGLCFSEGELNPAIRSVAAPLRVGDLGLPLAINCTHSRWSARAGGFEERVGPRLLQTVARIERSYGVMFPSERHIDDS